MEFWLAISIKGRSQQDRIIRGVESWSLPRAGPLVFIKMSEGLRTSRARAVTIIE